MTAYLTLTALQHLTDDVPENGLIKPSLTSTGTVTAYLTLAALQHLTYDVPENGLIKPSLTSTGTVTAYLTLAALQRAIMSLRAFSSPLRVTRL